MSAYKSDFLNVLASRGYVHQVSDADGLDTLAAAGKVVAYVGYDCTAPSLHVGHLLSIMMALFYRHALSVCYGNPFDPGQP